MILLPFRHPHPVKPQPSHSPSWHTHLRDEDLGAVLAALGAGDDAEAVPAHLVEQALLGDAGDDDAEASARWCLEVLATLEPRPRPNDGPPPWPLWPAWRGVGAGGVVYPRPAPRGRGLLPSLGVGAHQRGQVTFIATTSFVQLIAPADVVARLERRCGASFAAARAPWLDSTAEEHAAWAAAGLEMEAPQAYWWRAEDCPLVARVRLAIVWRPETTPCAWLWWPDGAPVMAPIVVRYGAGLPDTTEDARLTGAIRRVLGLVAAGGRPPAFASRDQYLAVVGTAVAELIRRRQPATASAVRRYLLLRTGHDFDAASWTRLHQRFGYRTWRDVLAALQRPRPP